MLNLDDVARQQAAWREPPRSLPLAQGDVHVWQVALGPAPVPGTGWADAAAGAGSTLSGHERRRMAGFRDQVGRRRYAVAHHALRSILSRYVPPGAGRLRFRTGPWGKPQLTDDAAGRAVSFSLSHGGDCALIAVGSGMEVGVDVEPIRPGISCGELAARFFTTSEAGALARSADPVTSFFRYWTKKESYVKGIGRGLTHPLDSFEVADGVGPAPVTDRSGRVLGWWTLELYPCRGYTGAVATGGWPARLCLWAWQPERASSPAGTIARPCSPSHGGPGAGVSSQPFHQTVV